MELTSWGRYPPAQQNAWPVVWRSAPLPEGAKRPLLPFGRGRSYGDSCLNDGGTLLTTSSLDRFISFDAQRGLLRCEAGTTLGEILDLVVPRGFFLPVVPGTQHVSVGGAIANDIHGKNHHRRGCFGNGVRRLELLRSTGERIGCSREENADWFSATVGGLGLTGLIVWVDLLLFPIASDRIEAETVPFASLAEFFGLNEESETRFEYTVAWIDCFSPATRGIYFRGNHAQARSPGGGRRRRRVSVPFDLPAFALNRATVRAFNAAYYHRHRFGAARRFVPYEPFFFPLDAVEHWNRLYGRRGFLQFQCVVPDDPGHAAIRALLDLVAKSRLGSFLGVLKTFGDVPSPGMLSFPRKGVTLTLDFANRGEATFALYDRLASLVRESGGALYPAKDARMSAECFAASYPRRREFEAFVDPAFSSSFWRRVTGAAPA